MIKLNIHNIFLLDAVGAFLSFLGTGVVLPFFSQELGIPIKIFYVLAIFPLVYCLYSFVVHFWIVTKRPGMLLGISCANLAYCLISFSVLFTQDSITALGTSLILFEIFIVSIVAATEYRIYRSLRQEEHSSL